MVGVGRKRLYEESSSSSEDEGEDEPEHSDLEDKDTLEPWVEWVQRATHISEEQLRKARLEDWVTTARRRKFRWAGHVARQADNRWAHKALIWEPAEGRRSVGRPKKRWEEALKEFFRKLQCDIPWPILAQCRETWKSYEDAFAETTG
jgi:hypothetical protein